ncbi:uncharacterized protein NEMAJ01_0353 [Nematocida major]|uniref:uncharacterized protein n=1 Tax=Nematocida major TaxID=1912982 RepID=UPI0020077347|nr:uncharacterized protein NEMAJ01_0353 [Nematocida major]KAH9385457.1 hypothetical protein NEMAJ01_0353 [Nematocida major]
MDFQNRKYTNSTSTYDNLHTIIPNKNLYEDHLVFNSLPLTRHDIVNSLINKPELNQRNDPAEKDALTKVKKAAWVTQDGNNQRGHSRETEFPLLTYPRLRYFFQWQREVKLLVETHQIGAQNHSAILAQIVDSNLQTVIYKANNFADQMKALQKEARYSFREQDRIPCEQNNFVFFKDYIADAERRVQFEDILGYNDTYEHVATHSLAKIVAGLAPLTKVEFIRRQTAGESYGSIFADICQHEEQIAESTQHYIACRNRLIPQFPNTPQHRVRTELPTKTYSTASSKQSKHSKTNKYCSFHKVNTHNTEECRKAKESSASEKSAEAKN